MRISKAIVIVCSIIKKNKMEDISMKNKKWFVILCGVLMFGLFCGIGMSEGAMEVQAAKIVKKDKT